MPILDANVLLRHLTNDNGEQSPRATAFLQRLAAGEERAIVPNETLFEVAFTLTTLYRRSREDVRLAIEQVVDLPGAQVPNERTLRSALQIYSGRNISIVDAYIAALALERDGQVISFDRDFDRIPGLTRVEP